LPKGRSIPVDLNMGFDPSAMSAAKATADVAKPVSMMPDGAVESIKQLSQSIRALSSGVSSIADVPANMPAPRPMQIEFPDHPHVNRPKGDGATETDSRSYEPDTTKQPDPDKPVNESQTRGITIVNKIEIRASDYDSFKRSEDQIARALGDKITKATRRIGGR
jgi:hypothetical protein